jgi:hypothetical protein
MLAHGFKREMLAGLVLAGLATVVTETMRAGAATIKVERNRITGGGVISLPYLKKRFPVIWKHSRHA